MTDPTIEFLKTLGLGLMDINRKTPSETKKLLKKAYLDLAQKYHPDKWTKEADLTEKETTEVFKKIVHAYKMLADPSYKLAQQQRDNPVSNKDAIISVKITFGQAFFGDDIIINLVPKYISSDGKEIPFNKKVLDMTLEVYEVKIPAGTLSGQAHIIKNRGMISKGQRGNAVFIFDVLPSETYRLEEGGDIFSEERVPLDIMIGGGTVEVASMWGLKTLKIRPGTQPGEKLEVKNCGVNRKGSHFVEIKPEFPTQEILKEKNIWKKLGIDWDTYTEEEEGEGKISESDLIDARIDAAFSKLFLRRGPTKFSTFNKERT